MNDDFFGEADPNKPNSIGIVLPYPKVKQGQKLIGVLKLFVNSKLPKGQIILRLDSHLDIRFRETQGKIVDNLVQECKHLYNQKDQKETSPREAFESKNQLLENIKSQFKKPS